MRAASVIALRPDMPNDEIPNDEINAFVPGPRVHIEGRPSAPLSGLTFAAKDLFDVAGHPTGGGHPALGRPDPPPAPHPRAAPPRLEPAPALCGTNPTHHASRRRDR